jgi:hemerythrin-like domain-containing protein
MKRHSSLVSLSRDHHAALILSRLLQKDAPAYKTLPTSSEGKAVYAFKFYNDELIKQFEQEEKVLSLVIGTNKNMDILIHSIFAEHKQLQLLFKSMEGHADLKTLLNETGVLLEKHIRKEERELFPMMQELCSEDQLTAIENILSKE